MIKHPLRLTLSVVALTFLSATPSFAVNKDMVQLQTQVQALQEAVARLQQSNDKELGRIQQLIEQTSDSVNRMTSTVSDLQKQLQTVQSAQSGKSDQVSGQIQAMNDSIDEIKTRMGGLDKSLRDIQSQQQSISASLQTLTQPPAAAAPTDGTAVPSSPLTSVAPGPLGPPSRSTSTPAAAPVETLYRAAFSDYQSAKNAVATGEFNDVIHFYPNNDLAGNAYFYLGEIDFHEKKYANAVKNFDHVLEQYPDNKKAPAAHLHKGESLIAQNQTSAGERELQALIARFPNSAEATLARNRLAALGVRTTPPRTR